MIMLITVSVEVSMEAKDLILRPTEKSQGYLTRALDGLTQDIVLGGC